MNTIPFPVVPTRKPKAVFLMAQARFDLVYGPCQREAIHALAEVISPLLLPETWARHPGVTCEAEWIFSSWTMPLADEHFLDAFPNLKAVFYAAGTVKPFVTEALWQRGVTVTSAFAANAIPVAEYTVAQIILSLKSAWPLALQIKREKRHHRSRLIPTPGVYDATVGLISLGIIGRMVAERLRDYKCNVIAYDPFISEETARKLGVRLCPLEELFETADVVSCHTPLLAETAGMLRKEHFLRMKRYGTFLNTSRGAIVDEAGLVEALRARPDLFAVLDVTWPEPPVPGSPLYELDNVILTPHIAGSKSHECFRLAQYMVDEARRLLAGKELQYVVTPELLGRMA
ncbi:MAG: hydroxyacid dehydrogenase [Chthoniobacteraceae bacterium]